MIRMFTYRKIAISTLLLLVAILLYSYPEEINNTLDKANKCAILNIYLIDKNDFVSLVSVNSDDEDKSITKIVRYMTIDSGLSLPKGFYPLIPKDTKLLDYSVDDGLLKLNFSKELFNVSLEDEENMIESIVYSLTMVEGVSKIIIYVEDEMLMELPKSHKRLPLYLDRDYGINKIVNLTSLNDTKSVTVYYLDKSDDYYYVPVTYITNSSDDKIDIIVNSLKSNKFNNSNLSSHLDYQVELMSYEESKDQFLLNFNSILLNSVYDGKLKEEVKYALSYSIFDTFGVKSVIFEVDSMKIDEFVLEK